MSGQIVWKFSVRVDDSDHAVTMHRGAKIVKVHASVPSRVDFWAVVDLDAVDAGQVEERTFRVVGTGHSWGGSLCEHVGTAHHELTGLVWHLLELKR